MKPLLALLLLAASAASAAVPQRLNYQGKLANASGDPVSGTYSFRFKLFAGETGGAALFSEDVTGANAQSVVNGIYSVQIGSYTAGGIPYGVFDGQDLYLEIDVNAGSNLTGAETLSPRERLNAAAWAVHALGAERLGTGAVVATFTSAGNLAVPGGVHTSSYTGFNSGLTQSFVLAVGSATDRSSYHLYVATSGGTSMGRAGVATAGSRLDVAGPVFVGGTPGSLFFGAGGWPYSIGVGWNGQDSKLRFNAVGTGGGTADFRDFWVYDGKSNLIAAFEGSTGRFGVGTSAPGSDLDVRRPAGSYPTMRLSDGNLTLPDYSGSSSVGDVSLSNAVGHFKSNRGGNGTNTEGGLLIQGFTEAGANAWYPLHLVGTHGGTAPKTAAVTVSGQRHSGTNNRAALAGTEPVFDVETNYMGALLLRVQGGGNVGVSTGSPQTRLDVQGDASFGQGAFKSTFTATPGGTAFALQTASGVFVASGPLYLNGAGAHLRFPDGSTMVSAGSGGSFVLKSGDFMSGQLTTESTVTVKGNAFSVGGTSFSVAGGRVGIGVSSVTGSLGVAGAGVGKMSVGSTGCGGDYTGISLNGSDLTGNCANYNILSSPSDQQLYINRPSGRSIYFRESNSTQMSVLTGGGVVTGGATAASGSGGTDLTATGAVYFGTGGSYRVTSAGAATLAASTVGDLTKNAAAFHLGNSGGSGTADAFVFWSGATGSGTRIASINHQKDLKAGSHVTTATPDIAEYIQAEKDVEAGDVVVVAAAPTEKPGPGGEVVQVAKSRARYDRRILGVISDGTSAFRIHSHMNDLDKEHPGKPLVLAGRVPVKVTQENGPIKAGDYLTSSSKPGFAMKATAPGPTVGIALEDFDDEKEPEGKVLAFIDVGERNLAAAYGRLLERVEALEERLEAAAPAMKKP